MELIDQDIDFAISLSFLIFKHTEPFFSLVPQKKVGSLSLLANTNLSTISFSTFPFGAFRFKEFIQKIIIFFCLLFGKANSFDKTI